MASVVLDASVAVKWLLADEDHARQALALRDAIISHGMTVAVPPHFAFEVAHTLVRAARQGRFDAGLVERSLTAVEALGFEVDTSVDLAVRAARLAQGLGTTVYDAAYLAVARARSATLITADRPLYEAGSAAGDGVAWLGDLPV